MSILSAMRYCLGPPDAFGSIWTALGFIPFGLFFDFMDGKVARWRHKSSLMGQELDSLADLVRSFRHRLLNLPAELLTISPGMHMLIFASLATGIVRRRSSCQRLRAWAPHACGSACVVVLRAVWADTTGALQCDSFVDSEGCDGQEQIL